MQNGPGDTMTEMPETRRGDDVMAVGAALLDLGRSVDRHLAELARKSDVSLTATRLLVDLDNDTLRCADLVRLSGYNTRTVAAALETLAEAGLVRRHTDERDARAKLVTVTDAGRDVARAVGSRRGRFAVDLLDVLTPHERDSLMTILAKLHARMEIYENPGAVLAPTWSEARRSDMIPADPVG